MKLKIEVQRSTRPNSANQVASFTTTIETEAGPLVIRDGRIIQSKSGNLWASLPTFSIPRGAGVFQYLSTIELPPTLAEQLSVEALRAYEQWKAGGAR